MKTYKTKLTENELLEMGFIKEKLIIHPSRVDKEDEMYIGQIDEKGERKDLLVYDLPKGFRFDVHIVVNYKNEILIYISGFMSGGIKVYKDLEHSDIYFREAEEWIENLKNLIDKIKE